MDFKKGYCRLELKSGLVLLGEILKNNNGTITFCDRWGSDEEMKIDVQDIVIWVELSENDFPPYE